MKRGSVGAECVDWRKNRDLRVEIKIEESESKRKAEVASSCDCLTVLAAWAVAVCVLAFLSRCGDSFSR